MLWNVWTLEIEVYRKFYILSKKYLLIELIDILMIIVILCL